MAKVTHLTLAKDGELANRHVQLDEIAGDVEAPLQTIGQDLRAARIRRGEDLATVSRILKIRLEHLEALEDDRLAALPGRTYAVGFVRAYADHVGLNPLRAVERFKTEIAGREDPVKNAGFPEIEEEQRLPGGWLVIGTVIIGLVAYGAYHLFTSSGTAVRQPVASVPPQIATKHAARPAAVKGKTAPVVPGTRVQIQRNTGANSLQGTMAGSSGAPAAPTGEVYGKQNENPRVVLRITQPTRLLVQDKSGKVFLNRALQPGDAYQVPNLPGLLLTVQHGNAVELDLDGQAMGTASQSPAILEGLSLDPQAIVDRYGNGNPE
jgi:cytoskeleton protein RodZ